MGSVVTSVHVANVGPTAAFFRAPKPSDVAGLISADGGLTSVLGPAFLPRLQPTRVGMVAFWEDEASLDAFLDSHPTAERFAGGWHARLEPLRAYGTWPGLDPDVARSRTPETDGPVVVTTLARLKISRARQFFTTSARAEGQVREAPGLIWASGFGSPPFLGTISLWESARAAADYAYENDTAHAAAIATDRAKTFHKQKAFIRYRVLASAGSVAGKNPHPDGALATS